MIWAARGSASRIAGIEPHRQAGQYMALEGYVAVEPILSLADIRIKEAEIMQIRDRLSAERGGSLRFPFVRYRDQGLRAFQAYLVEFPADLVALFPSLTRAMARLDVRVTGRAIVSPEQAGVSDRAQVGATYRAADEFASAAIRDPFSVDPALVERGCRGHAITQNALARFLKKRGEQKRIG